MRTVASRTIRARRSLRSRRSRRRRIAATTDVVHKPAQSADRERFLALASVEGAYLRTREDRTDAHLLGVYRMFATWIDTGPQRGAHIRGERGVRSERFSGEHNWIYLDVIDWAALPEQLALARTIAGKRNAGKPSGTYDVYKPLAKAVEVAQQKPRSLHAGGPRAKVLSGERELAVAICTRCMERLAHLARAGDDITRLSALIGQSLSSEVWWSAANALPYGTDGAKRAVDDAESAALQMVRATIGAANSGSQSCMPYATKALVRAVRELETTESWDAACAFLVEIDETRDAE